MGEFSDSDSSWKKMVLSKSDNEWTATVKSEEPEDNSALNATNFSIDYNPYIERLKSAGNLFGQGFDNPGSQSSEEPELSIVTEVDPLQFAPGRRRRGSGAGPKVESSLERSVRLAKMSAYAAQRLANETPEQRALRLKRMSAYAAKRLATETAEQRAKRLARMSAYAAQRLARETPEQRQARLTRMSAYAAKRQAMKKNKTSTVQSQDHETATQYE